MKIWLMAIMVGVISLVVFSTFAIAQTPAKEQKTITSCTQCGGTCTKDNNCGLSTCSAVTGGTCGCKTGA